MSTGVLRGCLCPHQRDGHDCIAARRRTRGASRLQCRHRRKLDLRDIIRRVYGGPVRNCMSSVIKGVGVVVATKTVDAAKGW